MDITKIADALSKTGEIVKIVYQDLAQPGVKQVGKALETSLGLVNTMLLPMKLLNEKASANFEQNMNKFRENIKEIPEEQINDVPPQLALPILDRFTYVTDNDIADLFINLLASASDKATINEAHPSFVQLIDRMSPDEAKLLSEIGSFVFIPHISGKAQVGKGGFIPVFQKYTGFETLVEMIFPQNGPLYFENFESMGIICDQIGMLKRDLEIYDALFRIQTVNTLIYPSVGVSQKVDYIEISRGFYDITMLGRKFIHACTRVHRSQSINSRLIIQDDLKIENEFGFRIGDKYVITPGNEGEIIAIGQRSVCVVRKHVGYEEIYICVGANKKINP